MLHTIQTLALAEWRQAFNNFWHGRWWHKVSLFAIMFFLGLGGFSCFVVLRGIAESRNSRLLAQALRELNRAGITPINDLAPLFQAIPSAVLFFSLAFLVLTSFSAVVSSVFLANDLDLLLTTPAPARAIFVVRFLRGLSFAYLILFVFLLPGFVGFGLGMEYSYSYYAMLPLVFLVFPLLPAGIGVLLTLMFIRWLPPRRARELVGLLGVVIATVWYLTVQSQTPARGVGRNLELLTALQRFDNPWLPSTWAARGLNAAGMDDWPQTLLNLSLFLGIAVLIFAACVWLAERAYFQGLAALAAQGGRVRTSSTALDQPPVRTINPNTQVFAPSTAVAHPLQLRRQISALLRKDWLSFTRDLRLVQSLIPSIAIAGLWTYQLILVGNRQGADINPQLAAMSSGAIGYFVSLMFSAALAGSGISREGKTFWLLQTAPISVWRILGAKLLLAFAPFPVIGGLFLCLLVIFQGLSWSAASYSFGLTLIFGLGATSISLGLGAAFPRLDWSDPRQQVTWRAGCANSVGQIFFLAGGSGFIFGVPQLGVLFPAYSWLFAVISWVGMVLFTLLLGGAALWFGATRLTKLEY